MNLHLAQPKLIAIDPEPTPDFYLEPVASPFDADASTLEAYCTGNCLRWQMTVAEAEAEAETG